MMEQSSKPAVYSAIAAVQGDLAKTGIGKDSENTFDRYKFRGIDAVYNALAPLLAKHGLCVLPRIIERDCQERVSRKGEPMFYVTVTAEFDFVAAADGTIHTVRTYGEAMDRSDKATNKAMSAAYKYAAFMTFAIPTEGDNDADAVTHEVVARPVNDAAPPKRVKLAGPYETQTALSAAVKAFMHEVSRAPDPDSLDALIDSESEMLVQVKRDKPEWWSGGPGIEKGLKDQLDERVAELREEAQGDQLMNMVRA